MTAHWTDDVPRPPFTTTIPRGNVFEMLGTAMRFLRELDVPRDRVVDLRDAVMASGDYEAAVALIGRWFPIEEEIL